MSTDQGRLDVSAVFREHSGLVERALRRCGVPERDLKDAQQEVFLVVHRRLHEFENRALLSTWLYRIAMNVASEHRRRACNRHERLSQEDSESQRRDTRPQEAVHEDALHVLEQRDLLALALRALEHLDPDKREVFVLYELMELSMTEVAAQARIPLKTAFSRLYAGRRQLLAELRKANALGGGLLIFLPFRTGFGRKLLEATATKTTVMGPLHATVAALAAVCALMPATGVPATSGRSPARAAVELPRAVLVASSSTSSAHDPFRAQLANAAQSVPLLPRPAAAASVRTATAGRTSGRGGASNARLLPPSPPSPAVTPHPDLDGFELVHASAVDLRPTVESPLAPAAEREPHRTARLHLSGPQDAVTGIEHVLSGDPAGSGEL